MCKTKANITVKERHILNVNYGKNDRLTRRISNGITRVLVFRNYHHSQRAGMSVHPLLSSSN